MKSNRRPLQLALNTTLALVLAWPAHANSGFDIEEQEYDFSAEPVKAPPIDQAAEDAKSAAVLADANKRLSDIYALLRSPDLSEQEKSLAIDAAIDEMATFMSGKHKEVANFLSQVNNIQQSEPVQRLVSQLPFAEQAPAEVSSALLENVAQAVGDSDPQVMQYRIKMTIELLRYVVNLRKQQIIAAASSERPTEKAMEFIKTDIEKFSQRIRCFVNILAIFQESSARHAQALAANDGKSSADNPRFTKDEIKRIGQNIAELNFIVVTKLVQTVSDFSTRYLPKNPQVADGTGKSELDFGDSLKAFQDGLAPMTPDEVVKIMTEDLGRPPSEVFINFDPSKPLKAASTAQTFRAEVRTWTGGTRTIYLKVQREGLEKSFEDSKALRELAMMAGKIYEGNPENATLFDVGGMFLHGFEQIVKNELSVSQETLNLERARMLLAFFPGVKIPKPIRKYSSRRILAMTEVPGTNMTTLLDTEKALSTYTRMRLLMRLQGLYTIQLFHFGELHADMHSGNLLAQKNGKISIVDWAQTFDTRGMIKDPVKVFYHLKLGNAPGFVEALARMNVGKNFQKEAFLERVEKIFADNKIQKRSLFAAVRKEGFVDGEQVGTVVESVLQVALEYGYIPQPKFFQLLRSSIPVGQTMQRLRSELPPWARKVVAIQQLLIQTPGLLAIAIAGRTLEFTTRPIRWAEMKLEERRRQKESSVRARAPYCRDLLAVKN